jgi:hypothetical protein
LALENRTACPATKSGFTAWFTLRRIARAAVLSAFCQGLAAGSPDFFNGLAVHPAHLAKYQTHNLWVMDATS